MTSRRLAIDVPPGEPAVIFRRFVDAPPDLAFAMWTISESHQRLDEWLEAIHNETPRRQS